MGDVLGELIKYWTSNGVEPAALKATEPEIEEWERRYNVVLPDDLREYVLRVNGIRGGEKLEWDHDCTSFLPLSAMLPEGEHWPRGPARSNMFVFADHFISTYWWCAALDNCPRDQTRIFLGGEHSPNRIVASSLAEFFQLYMEAHPRLHFG